MGHRRPRRLPPHTGRRPLAPGHVDRRHPRAVARRLAAQGARPQRLPARTRRAVRRPERPHRGPRGSRGLAGRNRVHPRVRRAARGKTGNDGQGNDAHRIDGTVAAAPARGDATTVFGYDGKPKTSHSIVLDHGSQALSQVRGTPHAKPGATLPARVLWASRRRPEPSDGTGYNPDPFATAALLGQAAAASPGACPTGLTATACYTAVVVSTDAGDPLAYEYTGVSRREGRAYLVLDVGVDPRGRLGFVRVAQTSRVLGRTDTVLTGTSRYTAYPDTPRPRRRCPTPTQSRPATTSSTGRGRHVRCTPDPSPGQRAGLWSFSWPSYPPIARRIRSGPVERRTRT